MMLTRLFAIVWVGAVAAVSSAPAQPLADRVPSDALIYVGWTGAKSLGPGFEGSHLQGVLKASQLGQLVDQGLPALLKVMQEDDPESAAAFEAFLRMARPMWDHPSAFYFGGFDLSKPIPMPKFALLCDAGEQGEALVAQWNKLLADVPPGLFPIKAEQRGRIVALYAGDLTADLPVLHNLLGGKPLSIKALPLTAAQPFTNALAKTHKSPALAAYVNVEGILAQVDQAITMQMKQMEAAGAPVPTGMAMWPKVRDASGLSGLKRVMLASGFDGKGWSDSLFIEAPAPRKGLLALMDSKPLSPAVYQAVPKTAAMAGAGRFDLAGLIGTVRATLTSVDPNMAAAFDGALAMGSQMIGIDIEKQLLAPFGDEWVFYTDAHVGGRSIVGAVLINRLRDPAAATKVLTDTQTLANQMMAAFGGPDEIQLAIKSTTYGGMDIHYLAVPFFAPSWTVKDGNLYVALQPQVVAAAAHHVASKAPGLDQNEAFMALRQRVGAQQVHGFQFADLPQTAPHGYETLLMMSRLFLGMADMTGFDAPPMAIAPLNALMPHMKPTGSFSWTSAEGMHARAASPFPGATVFGSQDNMMFSSQAMMVGMLLPAVAAARTSARHVQSSADVRMVHQALVLHAQDNEGTYPADIGIVVVKGYLEPDAVLSASSDATVPDGFNDLSEQQKRDWVNRHSAFVFTCLGRKAEFDSERVAGFEAPRPGVDMIAVVFDDNHTEVMDLSSADEAVRRSTGKSIDQWMADRRATPKREPRSPG